MSLDWQPSLLDGAPAPAFDPSFEGLTRLELDDRAWVDHLPGWVSGSDTVFEHLLATSPWKQRDMLLYGRGLTGSVRHVNSRSGTAGLTLPPTLADTDHEMLRPLRKRRSEHS